MLIIRIRFPNGRGGGPRPHARPMTHSHKAPFHMPRGCQTKVALCQAVMAAIIGELSGLHE
jgi:hypothetical protein